MSSAIETVEDVRTVAELLGSPRWSLAAPLHERLASWRAHGSPRQPIDRELAAKRLERWKSLGAFAKNPGLWEQRLASSNVTEDELLYLLGESAEQVRAHSGEPGFVEAIRAAYGDGGTTPAFPWPPDADLGRCRFLPLLDPLVRHFHDRLEQQVRDILAARPGAPFTPAIAGVLTSHLPDLFASMLNRTLVVEMHILKLEGQLDGDTPEARFEDFLRRLRSKEYALEILERYPVLARQLVLRLEQWSGACAEVLQRLADDAEALELRGRLTAVHGALADFHRDGRAVFILVFDSGLQLVYKPKPLALEARFQELLGWINSRGFEPELKPIRVLDRGDYGWMEYVYTNPCADEGALQRFLERQGGYLALLYVLDGTDFHHENLLACGEHPILIDLETLFQPWLNARDLHDLERAPGAALRSTVLRANLLPERWWGDKQNAGVDRSGLTAVEGQLTPRPMLAATDGGLDTMRMERRRLKIPVGENRVRLADRDVTAAEFVRPLEAGFRRMYALLAANREELSARLDAFAGCEMRLLFRNTMQYGTVLLESFHPHALGNALERDRLFDSLWTAVARRPFLPALAECEVFDLHRGDIPLFITECDSSDAVHWRGERFARFFSDSGLDRARRKVRELSASDLERQVAVIRDTFDALRLTAEKPPRPSYTLVPSTRPGAEELLALARKAGDRIVERAFVSESEALWLTLDFRDPDGWQLVPSGPDFYLGLTGVAFFLGHLGEATGDARYTEVARKALFAQKQQIAVDPKLVNGIGGFNGWGGIIYTLAHLGRLWNDPSLLDEAESYARRLPDLIAGDDMLDFIVGSAGCIASLEALAAIRPSAQLEELMRACGERLLAKAEPQRRGLGWRMPAAGDRALAGLSHGAAGIALALLRLYGRTGDARFRDAARQGIEFERSLFSEAEQNWPDLRAGAEDGVDTGDGRHYMLAWCHGAPGIGLARIAGLPWLDDADVRREIGVAVRSTLERGFSDNHSLCHGDLGNLELLFAAAEAFHDAELEAKAWQLAGGIAGSIRGDGWLFGLPGNIETPGLMAGLAGVGYGLLRLARPGLPRLLTLDH